MSWSSLHSKKRRVQKDPPYVLTTIDVTIDDGRSTIDDRPAFALCASARQADYSIVPPPPSASSGSIRYSISRSSSRSSSVGCGGAGGGGGSSAGILTPR